MTKFLCKVVALILGVCLTVAAPATDSRATRASAIRAKIVDPNGGLIVVAHRGCHNPAPLHGLQSAPENSLLSLDQCITLGVDVMETDVRRTLDGYLVMMHDETVDRTTNGKGMVERMTLAQIKALRLLSNQGGAQANPTEHVVPTLEEMLAHARGRIVLNLDIKAAIHGEVIAAIEQMGMVDQVIVKTVAGPGSPALAGIAPFDRVPFMPILSSVGDGQVLAKVMDSQASGRVKPIGYELLDVTQQDIAVLAPMARRHKGRLWANSLWTGKIVGVGGDVDALRSPDAVWGAFLRAGVTMIQTDEPEALRRYADTIQY